MFLAKSLAQKAKLLGFDEIVFMDSDPLKLSIYGKMAEHVSGMICPELNFRLTADAKEAIQDADYIITTIRPGGDDARCRDERAALDLGILGQETTGAAGFSFAMRTVSALAEYCELAKQYAKPGFKIFNFTNPAGVVSQTLRDLGYDFTYGICDAPSGLLRSIAELYHADPAAVSGECYGLNHLSYFRSIKLNGREIMPDLLADPRIYTETDMRVFKPDLVNHIGCILNEYLYYFYYRQEAVDNILRAGITRGEMIRDINKQMTAELSAMDVDKDFQSCLKVFEKWYGQREAAYMAGETGVRRPEKPWKFDIFEQDDGGYAGVALKYLETKQSGQDGEMILCVPNNGALPELLDTDVVEITCDIRNGNLIPRHIDRPSEMAMELIKRVKCYERLASRAIREKSIPAAIDCLMVHPLVNSYSFARDLVNTYVEMNREFTSGWK
jgi:6-phospho-beta-glucosidase